MSNILYAHYTVYPTPILAQPPCSKLKLFISLGSDSVNTPAEGSVSNNWTSIARQRISKHASLTVQTVVSAWSVQSGYKEVFGSTEQPEVKDRISGRQAPGTLAWEQRNSTESSHRN
jgi:hypothetical protein